MGATYRLYSDDKGESHIDKVDFEVDWKSGLDTTQITFRSSAVHGAGEWHTAPRRQFVIILSGQLEIGLTDGSKHIFGPGDARLVEDAIGKGHTTAVIGNEPCVTATVQLKDQ